MVRYPLVSIITPVYNCADVLPNTVESVMLQSYSNWELILVDDRSKDDSWIIARSFAAKDDRITVIQQEQNGGAARARNAGIEAANGRFIAFLDSDDLWLPMKLEKQVAFSLEKNAALTHTSYRFMNAVGEPTQKVIVAPAVLNYTQMLDSNFIGCLTAMYDTEHTSGKVYMPELRKRQDYALWLKIMRDGTKAYGLDEELALYRVGRASLSSNKLDSAKYNFYLLTKIEGLPKWKALYHFMRYFFIGVKKHFIS